jgi:hypothetical protein
VSSYCASDADSEIGKDTSDEPVTGPAKPIGNTQPSGGGHEHG